MSHVHLKWEVETGGNALGFHCAVSFSAHPAETMEVQTQLAPGSVVSHKHLYLKTELFPTWTLFSF